jgi:hypothetical protein
VRLLDLLWRKLYELQRGRGLKLLTRDLYTISDNIGSCYQEA